jgi:HEAT repeat protein
VAASDQDLIALVEALDAADDPERGRLGRELDDSGAREAAPRMAAAPDPLTRRAAARIMHLLPDESYLPALVPLVDDPDESVADAAWRALRGQLRTDDWRAAVSRIAADGPRRRREDAARWLSER